MLSTGPLLRARARSLELVANCGTWAASASSADLLPSIHPTAPYATGSVYQISDLMSLAITWARSAIACERRLSRTTAGSRPPAC